MEPAKLIDIALLFVLWLALSSTLLARFRLSSGWFSSAEITLVPGSESLLCSRVVCLGPSPLYGA